MAEKTKETLAGVSMDVGYVSSLLRKLPECAVQELSFPVRKADLGDVPSIVDIYKRVFAEPPWNETWSNGQVVEDIVFALTSVKPIMLVAEKEEKIMGFVWGYDLPLEKFPFLSGYVPEGRTSYIDEVAVDCGCRKQGMAKLLMSKYAEIAFERGVAKIVARTDVRNEASMALHRSLGFTGMIDRSSAMIFDPEYKSRVYLELDIAGFSKRK
jgi:ribosomal protein S18 acetylase RimI-like enzyme